MCNSSSRVAQGGQPLGSSTKRKSVFDVVPTTAGIKRNLYGDAHNGVSQTTTTTTSRKLLQKLAASIDFA